MQRSVTLQHFSTHAFKRHLLSTPREEKSSFWAASGSNFVVIIPSAIPGNEVTEILLFLCERSHNYFFGIYKTVLLKIKRTCRVGFVRGVLNDALVKRPETFQISSKTSHFLGHSSSIIYASTQVVLFL